MASGGFGHGRGSRGMGHQDFPLPQARPPGSTSAESTGLDRLDVLNRTFKLKHNKIHFLSD